MDAEKLNTVTVFRKGKEDKNTRFGAYWHSFLFIFTLIESTYNVYKYYSSTTLLYTIRYAEHAQTNGRIILNLSVDYYSIEKADKQLIL